jgi:hypothetical protein
MFCQFTEEVKIAHFEVQACRVGDQEVPIQVPVLH